MRLRPLTLVLATSLAAAGSGVAAAQTTPAAAGENGDLRRLLQPVQADDLPTYQLVIRDGRFAPEVVEVPANTKFRLRIRNEGPDAEEFESVELRKEKVLGPGAESFLIFQPLKAGSYRFFGEFHPQTAQGRIVAR